MGVPDGIGCKLLCHPTATATHDPRLYIHHSQNSHYTIQNSVISELTIQVIVGAAKRSSELIGKIISEPNI